MANLLFKTQLCILIGFLLWIPGPDLQAKRTGTIELSLKDLAQHFGLNRDQIHLSWDALQKIFRQIGAPIDKYAVLSDGKVTISRKQFRQLLKRMPAFISGDAAPPAAYIVRSAKYSGKSLGKSSRFILDTVIEIFKKDQYISIPILSADAAVSDIQVNDRPGLLTIQRGWYRINLSKRGMTRVRISFSITNGSQRIQFPIIRSAITYLDFTVPRQGYRFSGNYFALSPENAGDKQETSQLSAFLPTSSKLSLAWKQKRDPVQQESVRFYTKTNSLLSLKPNILQLNTTIDIEVLQSSLKALSLFIPEPFEIIRVSGSGASVGNWSTRKQPGGQILDINFIRDLDRRHRLNIQCEQSVDKDTIAIRYSEIRTIGTRRESGFIGIVSEGEAELEMTGQQGMEKIDYHKIPKTILSMTHKPILYAFKRIKSPNSLDIAIHRHQKLSGLSTLIESAQATVLFLENGKSLYRIEYFIRNSFKQFLQLEMPKKAGIWSVMIDGKREKASRNPKGTILIPLLRSSGHGDRLKAFRVVLTYSLPTARFGHSGTDEIQLPRTDLFLNRIGMDLYLPDTYDYRIDHAAWKKKAIPKKPRTVELATDEKYAAFEIQKPSSAVQNKIAGKQIKKGSKDKDAAMKRQGKLAEEDRAKMPAEAVAGDPVSDRIETNRKSPSPQLKMLPKSRERLAGQILTGPAGLNSIRIDLPISGRKYSFTKSIVNKFERFPIRFQYKEKRFFRFIYFTIALLILLLVMLVMLIRRQKSGTNSKKTEK